LSISKQAFDKYKVKNCLRIYDTAEKQIKLTLKQVMGEFSLSFLKEIMIQIQ